MNAMDPIAFQNQRDGFRRVTGNGLSDHWVIVKATQPENQAHAWSMEGGDFGELSRAASPPPRRSRGSPSRHSEVLSVGATLTHQPGPCVPVKECAQQGCCACDHADRAAKQRIGIRKREPIDRTVLIGPDERENAEAGKS